MKEIFFWKKSPCIRLLLAQITGIVIQWYQPVPKFTWLTTAIASLGLIWILRHLSLFKKFYLAPLIGGILMIPAVAVGALLVHFQDIRNSDRWFGHQQHSAASIIATLDESVIEKPNSFKANALLRYQVDEITSLPLTGKVILYFKKDSVSGRLIYGTQILFKNKLQPVKNSTNPGGFDFARYSLFQGITHQAYLEGTDFVVLPGVKGNPIFSLLEENREQLLTILRNYIHGQKEAGLAEALLIGYKNDLDKTLVESYANTGVVHVIAISGLHLGLSYMILVLLLKPLDRWRYARWFKPFLILAGLWLFTFMAGAQPSILRSAVMFTFIVAGESLSKRTPVINNLALSGFCLLCYNPFWLWDVGFQLSYTALLSIVIFMKPVYRLLYIKNKWLDYAWQLNAVTLAAQILTTPVSIYHFHQFPIYFMFTNLVAVPLSSLILIGEIILCTLSFAPSVAQPAGAVLEWMIRFMNGYIEMIEQFPFSVWRSLQINLTQTTLFYIAIAAAGMWMMEKRKSALPLSLCSLFFFFVLRDISFYRADLQRKLIVYNLSKCSGIDLIDRRQYHFVGDSAASLDPFTENFHLRPSRVLHRADNPANLPTNPDDTYISFGDKKIMLLRDSRSYRPLTIRPRIDLIIITQAARPDIQKLSQVFDIGTIVIDGSVSRYNRGKWTRECENYHVRYHDVTEKGAFVMTLN